MKKFTTLVFIATFIFCGNSFSQFTTEWTENYQHTTANNFSNEGRKVISDAAGNSYVLADVTSNIDPNGTVTATTYHYTVLSKYSKTGALLLTRNINVIDHDGSGFDNKGAFGMELQDNNYIYIGFIVYDAATNFDVMVSKYNKSLTRLWTRKYNPLGSDIGVDLGISGSGEAYALVKSVSGANTTYSIIAADSQYIDNIPLYSFTANTDVLNAIAVKTSSIYVTGYRLASGVKTVLTARVNDQGTLKWLKTFNGGSAAGDDFGKAITVGADGYIYVAGTSDQGPPTENDVIVMKFQNSNGLKLWSKYADHGITDDGLLIEAPDVNFVYVGSVSSMDVIFDMLETGLGNSGGRAVYSPVPASPYSFLNGAVLSDLKVSTGNGFYLTGSILATDMSNRLFSSSWLIKYSLAPNGSRTELKLEEEMPIEGDFSNSKAGVSIALEYFKEDILWLRDFVVDYAGHLSETVNLTDYSMTSPLRPGNVNPADEVSIELNSMANTITIKAGEKISRIELFDITGKNVKTITTSSEKVTIDTARLTNGIYIGKMYLESGTITTRKIIKN